MHIRDAHADDAPQVRNVLTQAFADTGQVADLAAALSARPDRRPPPWSPRSTAHPSATSSSPAAGSTRKSTSWTSSSSARSASHPPASAGASAARCARPRCDRLDNSTHPRVFLEGDPRYYAQLGWSRASSHGFRPPSIRIPDAGFQVMLLAAWQPWMTGRLVYNDTFWALDLVGLRSQHSAAGSDEV